MSPKEVNVPRAQGVVAGLVAAWVKALIEPPLQTAAEGVLPPTPSQKQEVGADPTGRPDRMPPAVLADRVAVALGRRGLSTPQRLQVQRVIHYGFGAGLRGAHNAPSSPWEGAERG